MKLPLVDEVREARAAAIEAQRAFQDAARIDAALRAVELVEQEARRRGASDLAVPGLAIPGDAEIADIAEAWPALADLPSASPAGGRAGSATLAARRAQLELARAHLHPLGQRMHAAFALLQDLQRRQQEALSEPKFEKASAEILARIEARAALEQGVQPFEAELLRLDLLLSLLRTWLARIEAERQDDDTGARTARVLVTLRESLDPLLDGTAIGLEAPTVAEVNPDAIGAVLERFEHFAGRVAARRKEVAAEVRAGREACDRVNAWLAARIG